MLLEQEALTQKQFQRVFAWSRIRGLPCPPEQYSIQSSAMGYSTMYRFQRPGRVDIDLCFEGKKANPLERPNLKLNTVAQHYLGEAKID